MMNLETDDLDFKRSKPMEMFT